MKKLMRLRSLKKLKVRSINNRYQSAQPAPIATVAEVGDGLAQPLVQGPPTVRIKLPREAVRIAGHDP